MKFKIVLSDKGKEIYSGGNVPVMKKMLFSFDAKDMKHAEKYFYSKLIESLGSGSEYLFKVERVK